MQNKKQFLQLVSNETEHVEFTPRKLLNMSIMYNCIAAVKQLDDFSYRHIGHFSFPSNQSLYCLLFNFSFSIITHWIPWNPSLPYSPMLSHVPCISMSSAWAAAAPIHGTGQQQQQHQPGQRCYGDLCPRSARKIPTVDGGMVNGKFWG